MNSSDPEIIAIYENLASLTNRINALHTHKLRQIDENRKISKLINDIDSTLKMFEQTIDRIDNKLCFEMNTLKDEIKKLKINYNEDTFKKISELEKAATQDLSEWTLIDDRISQLEKSKSLLNSSWKVAYNELEDFNKRQVDWNQHIDGRLCELEANEKACIDADPLQKTEERLQEIEKTFDLVDAFKRTIMHLQNEDGARPYVCPVCDGKGKIKIFDGTMLFCNPPKHPTEPCNTCNSKGIVWG